MFQPVLCRISLTKLPFWGDLGGLVAINCLEEIDMYYIGRENRIKRFKKKKGKASKGSGLAGLLIPIGRRPAQEDHGENQWRDGIPSISGVSNKQVFQNRIWFIRFLAVTVAFCVIRSGRMIYIIHLPKKNKWATKKQFLLSIILLVVQQGSF